MVDSAVRVRPSASGATRNSDTPLSVRAATRIRLAVWPSSTYIFVPSRVHESPEPVACMVMPASSQRPFSSVNARVARVSPDAMPGSSSFLASSSPLCSSVLAASTHDEK